jgi:hypothetical protein
MLEGGETDMATVRYPEFYEPEFTSSKVVPGRLN